MDKSSKNYEKRQDKPINTNFEEIFYQSPIGILIYDKEGRLINANDSALCIARIPKLEDVLNTNIFDNPIIAAKREDLLSKGLVKFQDSLNLIQIKEHNIYDPIEPKIIDSDWTISVTDSGYLIQIQDITKQKKVENENTKLYKEIEKNSADLQAVLDIAPIVIWIAHDPDCNVITGNDYADNMVMNVPKGGNISASAKKELADVVYRVYQNGIELKPEEMPAQLAASTGKPVPETELELVFSDGRKIQLRVSAVPLFDKNGNVRGSITAGVDVTSIKYTENALRKSEERLRLAQTLGNVGVWDWDTVTDELNFTAELEQLYGLSSGTIETYDDWCQLTHPDDLKKVETERDQKISNHEPFDLEFRIIHKSGEPRWLSATGGAIYDENGNVLRVLGVNTDITERKITDQKIQDLIEQLQKANEEYSKSEERFRNLADNIPNLAWMADANGWIFWYNKQWYEYTGTTLEEMQGWGWQKVHHPDFVDNVTGEWSTNLLNEEPYDNIFPLRSKDGKYRWFLTRVIPIRDKQGRLQSWFGTNTDITEQKDIEENLQITMDELKKSNQELEQFAYITSHDLREPLRMITSFLQLLKLRYKNELDEDANEFIGFAVDGAKRLDAMTNDLLEYSKITRKKREIIPVNFEHVLEHALTNLKVQIEENNAIITHEKLPTINGDEQLKIQLFQNIIGNALKYRSQETPVIHISAKKERNQYIFSIKDNGIGMSSDHLEQIFTIFKRLHTHEEYEGTGIGLAIAQKIVNQQGGEIWAESILGTGTTFYFTIPIQ